MTQENDQIPEELPIVRHPLPWYVAGPLVGLGVPVMLAALASALAGTWFHGYRRPHLAH